MLSGNQSVPHLSDSVQYSRSGRGRGGGQSLGGEGRLRQRPSQSIPLTPALSSCLARAYLCSSTSGNLIRLPSSVAGQYNIYHKERRRRERRRGEGGEEEGGGGGRRGCYLSLQRWSGGGGVMSEHKTEHEQQTSSYHNLPTCPVGRNTRVHCTPHS